MILTAIFKKYKKTKIAIQSILVVWVMLVHSGLLLYADTQYGPAVDPYDHKTFFMSDDFASGSTSSSQICSLGWRIASIGAALTLTGQVSTTPNIGVLGILTTSTSAQGGVIYSNVSSTAAEFWSGNLSGRAGWECNFIFQLASTTSQVTRIGFTSAVNTGLPTNGLWVRVDTQNSSDTNFTFEARLSSTSTTYTTSVAADTNFHRINISSGTAGSILFRLYSASGALQDSYTFTSGTPTSTIMVPAAILVTGTSEIKQLNLDYFSYLERNLAR